MKKVFTHSYNSIISVENLLLAWQNFLPGKRSKPDVQEFQLHLMDNILDLHRDLKDKAYIHGSYKAFKINDPKPRNIHKASVRDRLLHHAIYQILYPFFDKTFISDSYSCRVGTGTHKAIKQFTQYSRKVSQNYTKQCWVLKCDIKRFFDSIDHEIMIEILKRHIKDQELLNLLINIIHSFETKSGKGLPLGNLTSQLLVNIYMNEFDQYVKHRLKVKYYVRYADDFVFLHQDKKYLQQILKDIEVFLQDKLKLTLHPHKVSIETFSSGVDFLGWVHFPHRRVLRTVTKKRIFRGIKEKERDVATVQSYLGLLSHGDTKKIKNNILNILSQK
jgi:RNA-directed DNA polymerase